MLKYQIIYIVRIDVKEVSRRLSVSLDIQVQFVMNVVKDILKIVKINVINVKMAGMLFT